MASLPSLSDSTARLLPNRSADARGALQLFSGERVPEAWCLWPHKPPLHYDKPACEARQTQSLNRTDGTSRRRVCRQDTLGPTFVSSECRPLAFCHSPPYTTSLARMVYRPFTSLMNRSSFLRQIALFTELVNFSTSSTVSVLTSSATRLFRDCGPLS